MKKLFFAALAVCVFASCSKDNNEAGTPEPGKQASLNISVTSPDMTRAGGFAPSTDNTVADFTVFVVDDMGNIPSGWEKHFTSAATAGSLTVSTSAKKVYVIANAGDKTGIYTTEAALVDGAKEDLNSQFNGRWATGAVSIATGDWVTDPGTGNVTATKSLSLDFIAARIRLTVVNNMINYDGSTAGTTILSHVAVLNARGQSRLFPAASGTSLIPAAYDANKKFLAGIDMSAMGNKPAPVDFTLDAVNLKDAYSSSGGGDTKTYYYYVYENDAVTAATLPTIVTLIGTNAENIPTPVYFPVHLAPYEKFTPGSSAMTSGLKRGRTYDVTMDLRGDATEGNGGGGTDPSIPVTSASVDVSISINDWIPVTLGKQFE